VGLKIAASTSNKYKVKECLMQFKIGDMVVLPTRGIGQIKEVEEKNFSEQGARLYYKVALSEHTIWIPVETHQISGLRPVTVKGELDQYRTLLKSPPIPLELNHHRRHLELIKRLKEGSFQIICEVVRDLTAWSWRKPLGQADTSILQKTRQSLYQEWATAAGVSTIEAIEEVDSLLVKTHQVFAS
jgi:RNA polymerase-interacting CarD/CdnL/TRCF family regulator